MSPVVLFPRPGQYSEMYFESLTRNVVPIVTQRLRLRLASLPALDQSSTTVRLRVGISATDGELTHILHAHSLLEAILTFETLRDSGYRPIMTQGMEGRVHRVYGVPHV